jgi:hypothetical protein
MYSTGSTSEKPAASRFTLPLVKTIPRRRAIPVSASGRWRNCRYYKNGSGTITSAVAARRQWQQINRGSKTRVCKDSYTMIGERELTWIC